MLAHYEKIGVMRRYAAILRHRDAGFVANGMIVWKVPKERISEVGETLGAFPQVSHCYERPSYPDWPYNVFSNDTLHHKKGGSRGCRDEIQWTFPLVQRPYDTLAEKFNQSPSVIKERILRLRESGILRQMSAIFDTRRLGYKSSLVAAKVESDKLDSVAELINKHLE